MSLFNKKCALEAREKLEIWAAPRSWVETVTRQRCREVRDEKGTNGAPLSAKNEGQSPSLNRQLFRLTPISRQPFSMATSTSSLTNVVFVYVSLP